MNKILHYGIAIPFIMGVIAFVTLGEIYQPTQQEIGPGGSEYTHEEVSFLDFAKKQDGYFLFQPSSPTPKDAPVVVFLHGYSASNPMVFGQFIQHLVKKGSIVIFPRYQKNMFIPKTDKFVPNSVTAIKDAMLQLEEEGFVKPEANEIHLIGHSFGGVIIANMLTEWEELGIPKPVSAMLVSPGTGPFEDVILESYEAIPKDVKMLITVSENDMVTGDVFAKKVFNEAINTPQRNLVKQFSDPHGDPAITSDHLEIYATLDEYDSGNHGYSYQRAKNSVLDAVDYNGYWKLFDGLMACTRSGELCDYAFGDTQYQKDLGLWSDGTPIKGFEVMLPAED